GFCWYSPLPMGGQQNALWGSAWNDVWAGGVDGLAHYDGKAWSAVQVPGAGKVRALWGSSAQDIWAAGDELFRWDGKSWTAAQGLPAGEASYLAVTGSGPRDVYVLSDTGDGPAERHTILHWDGA